MDRRANDAAPAVACELSDLEEESGSEDATGGEGGESDATGRSGLEKGDEASRLLKLAVVAVLLAVMGVAAASKGVATPKWTSFVLPAPPLKVAPRRGPK